MIELITSSLQGFAIACTPGDGGLFLPTWYKYLEGGRTGVTDKCTVVINSEDLAGTAGRIMLALIEILLRVGGLVAVAFVIYGGFNYITSQGQPDHTKSARQTIINAMIGVVITTVATVIVSFVGREFIK
jgi:ABC-type Fe3+ transport system permease subunit